VTASTRLWPLLALAVVAMALAVDVWNHPEEIGIDFHTYEAAAQVGLQQGWSDIYDQDLVAAEQKTLVPDQRSQPFLSPPTVAWLTAPLALLPYSVAFYVWAGVSLAAFAVALAWSATSQGLARWIAAGGALGPWWVMHAIRLGQVVPLVATGVLLAWRLIRQERQVAAGLALSLILLKPNTAILVPFALLAAGRYKTFATWAAAGILLSVIALVTLGTHGMSSYLTQLTGPLPSGAAALTLEGALGIQGSPAAVLRLAIAAATLAAAWRLRASPGLVISVGIVGSLLMSPYLHASDLCLLCAAAFIVWEERPALAWRLPLATAWLIATPLVQMSGFGPTLNRWPLLELVLLVALMVAAWRFVGPRARDRVVSAS
jgi:alpha-1,2-mannosyltransferase